MNPKERVTSAGTVFKTPWFSVEEEKVEGCPAYSDGPFYKLVHDESVVILALDQEGKVILVEQFRPALRKKHLELPAGAIHKGETPEQAARRELKEETGYAGDHFEYLGKGHLRPDRENVLTHMFLARGVYASGQDKEETSIEVKKVSCEDLIDLLDKGDLEHLIAANLIMRTCLDAFRKEFSRFGREVAQASS